MSKNSVWKYGYAKEVDCYIGWLLAAKLAEWLGLEAGIYRTEGIDKIAVLINLPSGQIHRVLPDYIVEGRWKEFDESKFEHRSRNDENLSIEDCLNGTLVHRHILIIPEEKEETE